MQDINSQIPIASGGIFFYIMLCFPLLIGSSLLLLKKEYRNTFLLLALPFVTYFINSIVKIIIQRFRPPIELHIEEHMNSFSYVSRHTFMTACLWGMFVFIIRKYCKNRIIKIFSIILALIWILFEGFSRIWMGVHYPTDVIGAYILAVSFVFIYVRLIEKVNEKNK